MSFLSCLFLTTHHILDEVKWGNLSLSHTQTHANNQEGTANEDLLQCIELCYILSQSTLFPLFLQGVFINPAFIEPFGLTLIEVVAFIWLRFFKCAYKKKGNHHFLVSFFSLRNRQQPMVCRLLLQKMAVLLIFFGCVNFACDFVMVKSSWSGQNLLQVELL